MLALWCQQLPASNLGNEKKRDPFTVHGSLGLLGGGESGSVLGTCSIGTPAAAAAAVAAARDQQCARMGMLHGRRHAISTQSTMQGWY